MEDRVFAKPQDRIVDFAFNSDVVDVLKRRPHRC